MSQWKALTRPEMGSGLWGGHALCDHARLRVVPRDWPKGHSWISLQDVADGATVRAYDPAGGEAAADLVSGLEVAADPYDACAGAEALCLLTEWDEFRWLDLSRAGGLMAQRAIVDARNLLDPAAMRHLGFSYRGIGR